MVKPIPDNVKNCLGELSASQQVILRTYIGSLRSDINDLENQIRTVHDPDPHAHYHGHEKVNEWPVDGCSCLRILSILFVSCNLTQTQLLLLLFVLFLF